MIQTKDSGKRDFFNTGAHRDVQDNKPRFDLIPLWMIDFIQTTYGGSKMNVDTENEPFTGMIPPEETRPDLIPDIFENRIAALFHRGAIKYGDNNWQKGIPMSRVYASLFRHMMLWYAGDTSEDHLAAIAWNASTLMWTEHQVTLGNLPEELADAGPMEKRTIV